MFLYPASVDWNEVLRRLEMPEAPQVNIIRNSPLQPPSDVMNPAVIRRIAEKSLSSLIRAQGIGDLYRIYYTIQRDGMLYNLAYIPPSFDLEPEETFDRDYMNALFDLGYKLAHVGYSWEHTPPGVEVSKAGL